ncbi:hypothetical protein ACFX2I_028524 [Malus domestica]
MYLSSRILTVHEFMGNRGISFKDALVDDGYSLGQGQAMIHLMRTKLPKDQGLILDALLDDGYSWGQVKLESLLPNAKPLDGVAYILHKRLKKVEVEGEAKIVV